MTEHDWLTSSDPTAMLAWISGPGRRGQMPASTKHSEAMKLISNRKLRLFACAVARHGGCSTWVSANVAMMLAAEKMADGAPHGLTEHEIEQVFVGSWLLEPDADRVARVVLQHYKADVEDMGTATTQSDILRGIVGNPFRRWLCCLCARGPTRMVSDGSRVAYACARCATRDFRPLNDTVTSLATAVYHERRHDGTLDPDRLLVLSDALVDAGCESAEILNHLRQSAAVYYRGDWVVDLLLGKD